MPRCNLCDYNNDGVVQSSYHEAELPSETVQVRHFVKHRDELYCSFCAADLAEIEMMFSIGDELDELEADNVEDFKDDEIEKYF